MLIEVTCFKEPAIARFMLENIVAEIVREKSVLLYFDNGASIEVDRQHYENQRKEAK